jgi:hypothetical protein
MKSLFLLFLLSLIYGQADQNKANRLETQPNAEQSNEAPDWYITDTGIEVVDGDGSGGYFLVEGMWYATSSIKDKQLTAPIAVKIACSRQVNICRESDATIAMGILQPDLTDYDVSVWNRQRIVAEDSDEGPCKISHRLVIDFKSKTVTLTDLPSQVQTTECKHYRDANSYILHGGQVMLVPTPRYNPLKHD